MFRLGSSDFRLELLNLNLDRCARLIHQSRLGTVHRQCSTSTASEDRIKQCYLVLNVPMDSNQDTVRKAFLELAKRYHPDSGHEAASMDKFCEIEDAFRVLTKKNTGTTEELKAVVEYDIKHTAPQHRQYLSFDGQGHGTPSQRQKQHAQARVQNAAHNVVQHRVSRAIASDNALLKRQDDSKHDIKTRCGFDRLVEDLIQEAMSKGEFDNLSGKGKPLKGQNYNPYVDFTTHKINEVLINNGFTPEWIMLNKDIIGDISWMKEQLTKERARLGPLPLSQEDHIRWKNVCDNLRDFSKKINSKILSFNLIVPILNKQKCHIKFDELAEDVLMNGTYESKSKAQHIKVNNNVGKSDDTLIELASYLFSFIYGLLKKDKTPKCKD